MRRRQRLIERIRGRIPRESPCARLFEPVASMLTTNRGLMLPTLRYVRRHGLGVKSGPFAGLRYPPFALLHVPGLATRLAGAYEVELQPAVEELIASDPALVVNIGAGDGYYAVGVALRCPRATVVAFEADPYQAHVCARLARANGVADRIDLRGTCTTSALAELRPPQACVLISDCEGGEAELIDPARVPWLRRCPLLVEAHETLVPGIEARLRERLSGSHRVERLEHGKRYVERYPPLRETPSLSAVEKEILISELRPWHTPWLWAVPLDGADG